MYKILLVTVLFVCNIIFSDDVVTQIMKDLDTNSIPKIQELKFKSMENEVNFYINSYLVRIKTSYFESAKIIVERNNEVVLKEVSNFKIWGHYLEKVISFDIDSNGLLDFFIISTPVGASGDAANIKQINGVLFYKNHLPKLYDFSSFFGAENLFADFNKDNIYDFACIKLFKENQDKYYIVNIFTIIDNKIINITSEVDQYPKCFKQSNGYILLRMIPYFLKNKALLKAPDVFQ